MQNTDIKDQYTSLKPGFNLNYDSQQNHQQPKQTKTKTNANLAKKEPSQLITLTLVIATISLYGFGIHQLSNTVIDIVDTVVEEVNKDYRFKVF